ncbi:metal-dependent transcriptional regulator [Haloplasma contractile]|uniref:Manganese transport regulator n=1 Tax=Haloplasma contractile SSD-17B TaxID=1033810 RepID=U2FHM1_9MOLU|nr:iron dependent repressor, metal binding and dimerization domain protein [Haloplasma contractile]ERJ12330.1 nitrate reductase 2 alpha subunit protein [Haloplasma contractile SSD-17B]
MLNNHFFTFSESMKRDSKLTASEEDYIEMIYRLCVEGSGYTRVSDIAISLHVKPPSVSNMLKRLSQKKLIKHADYGTIELTDSGQEIGCYLLERHKIVERFLKILKIKDQQLFEDTEKIEHTISNETLESLRKLVLFFEHHDDLLQRFYNFTSVQQHKQ